MKVEYFLCILTLRLTRICYSFANPVPVFEVIFTLYDKVEQLHTCFVNNLSLLAIIFVIFCGSHINVGDRCDFILKL